MKSPNAVRGIAAGVIVLLCGAAFSGINLLRNGDFERFTGDEPDGWTTTNIPKALTVVSPTTKAHSGKYAVKCEVKSFYGSQMAGMITQKNIRVSGTALELKGEYVLNSVGKDAGFITLELQSSEGSTVKICQEYLSPHGGEYAAFQVSGDIPPAAVKAEIRVTLLPAKESERLHEGSYLLLDDLVLSGIVAEGDVLPE
ncbi:MAG: hypothetical protein AB1428_04195 [Bacteroidota bacterium]